MNKDETYFVGAKGEMSDSVLVIYQAQHHIVLVIYF